MKNNLIVNIKHRIENRSIERNRIEVHLVCFVYYMFSNPVKIHDIKYDDIEIEEAVNAYHNNAIFRTIFDRLKNSFKYLFELEDE